MMLSWTVLWQSLSHQCDPENHHLTVSDLVWPHVCQMPKDFPELISASNLLGMGELKHTS